MPEDGTGIPAGLLPFLVLDALDRWWGLRNEPGDLLMILPATPYLNAGGLEEADFLNKILADSLA